MKNYKECLEMLNYVFETLSCLLVLQQSGGQILYCNSLIAKAVQIVASLFHPLRFLPFAFLKKGSL